MQDLIQLAFASVNLGYTILLMVVLLYWLSVVLGAIDLDTFDLDLDMDADVDGDIDVDTDVDAASAGGGNVLASVLAFFNFGKVPFMLIMSVVILTAWTLAVLANHYIGDYRWSFALATAGPVVLLGFIVAKAVTTPLVPVFAQLDTAAGPVEYIGQICRLRLPASAEKFGQAEVLIDDAHLLVDVKTEADAPPLQTGEHAIILRATDDGRHFLVRRLEEQI